MEIVKIDGAGVVSSLSFIDRCGVKICRLRRFHKFLLSTYTSRKRYLQRAYMTLVPSCCSLLSINRKDDHCGTSVASDGPGERLIGPDAEKKARKQRKAKFESPLAPKG